MYTLLPHVLYLLGYSELKRIILTVFRHLMEGVTDPANETQSSSYNNRKATVKVGPTC